MKENKTCPNCFQVNLTAFLNTSALDYSVTNLQQRFWEREWCLSYCFFLKIIPMIHAPIFYDNSSFENYLLVFSFFKNLFQLRINWFFIMTLFSPENSLCFLLLFSGAVHWSHAPPPHPYLSKQSQGLVKESYVWVLSNFKLLTQKKTTFKNPPLISCS